MNLTDLITLVGPQGATGPQGGGGSSTVTEYNQAISATFTISWSNSSKQHVLLSSASQTCGGMTGPTGPSNYLLRVSQGVSGGTGIAKWPSNTYWPGGVVPVISSATGAIDIIAFYFEGVASGCSGIYYGMINNNFAKLT